MPSLGEEFRAAREARKLSLADVADQIHIRPIYLQSIEEENWPAISAPVYVRGFLRTYARFIGVNPEHAIEHYNSTLVPSEPVPPPATAYKSEQFEGPVRPSPLILTLGAVALLLVTLLSFTYFQGLRSASVQTATVTEEAVASAGGDAAVAPGAASAAEPTSALVAGLGVGAFGTVAASSTLSVRALATSWLRVVIDGKAAFEGLVTAGSEKTFHGRIATVRVGNAGGIEVAVNGRNLGTLGAPGTVVERSFPLIQEQDGR